MRAEGERVRDPVCAFHGKRWSEHEGGRCLYCCACFKTLTPDECATDSAGQKWDICEPCSELEWHQAPGTCPHCGWHPVDGKICPACNSDVTNLPAPETAPQPPLARDPEWPDLPQEC